MSSHTVTHQPSPQPDFNSIRSNNSRGVDEKFRKAVKAEFSRKYDSSIQRNSEFVALIEAIVANIEAIVDNPFILKKMGKRF